MNARVALSALAVSFFLSVAPAIAGVGRWTPAGPSGGGVASLAVDPEHAGHLYAATTRGGLFKTIDGGRRWLPVSSGLPSATDRAVGHLVVAPSRPATVFAAVRSTGMPQPWEGLYRSLDAGLSWERRGAPPAGSALVVSGADPDLLFVAGFTDPVNLDAAVFRSVDGGTSWQRVLTLPPEAWPFGLAAEPPGGDAVFAWTQEDLWRSRDLGESWEDLSRVGDLGERIHGLVALAGAPSAPATVYAVGDAVYRSGNRGASWQRVSARPAVCGRRIVVHPRRPSTVYLACTDRLVRSVDGGMTWTDLYVDAAGFSPWLYDLAIDPFDARTLYVGVDVQGVYKSRTEGAAWIRVSAGLERFSISQLVLDPFAPRTLYAITPGIIDQSGRGVSWLWRSLDGGETWLRWLPAFEKSFLEVLPDTRSPGSFYLATTGGLFLQDQVAGTRRRLWDGPAYRLAVDAGKPDLLYLLDDDVFRSPDGGRSWKKALDFPPVPPGNHIHRAAFDLLADPFLSGRVYVPFEDGIVGGESSYGMYRSDDRGLSWTVVDWQGPDLHFAPNRSPGGPSTLYSGTSVSTDGGETWQLTGFPGPMVLIVSGDPTTFYVQDQERLFRSRDGGATWLAIPGGKAPAGPDDLRPPRYQTAIAHPAVPERLFASGSTGGVLRAEAVNASGSQLQGGRFELRASWRDAEGRYGAAQPVPLSDRSVAFGLGGRRRLIAVVDLLDRRDETGHFRVVGASLLPMETTVTVVDRVTGQSRDLYFPREEAASDLDVDRVPPLPEPFGASGPAGSPVCSESTAIGLLGGQFRVRVVRQPAAGTAEPAPMGSLRWEAGAACFDDPAVPSVAVQMVDGRAVNGSTWVLVGGLSEDSYVVEVTDLRTGAIRRYAHAAGPPASSADLHAF